MKTLRQDTNIEKYVSELNGYLSAVSHLNDTVGYRHRFFADMIYLNGKQPLEAIKKYLKKDSLNIQEINLREELRIIEKYIFHNFMLGDELEETKNLAFIKDQFSWHIQEYITLAAMDKKEEVRWANYSQVENGENTVISVKIEKYLIVMWFNFRTEDVNKQPVISQLSHN